MTELALEIIGSEWEDVAHAISSDLGTQHRAEEPAARVMWEFPELAEDHAKMLLHDALDRADRERSGLQVPEEAEPAGT
jgi:hypothetical protein